MSASPTRAQAAQHFRPDAPVVLLVRLDDGRIVLEIDREDVPRHAMRHHFLPRPAEAVDAQLDDVAGLQVDGRRLHAEPDARPACRC